MTQAEQIAAAMQARDSLAVHTRETGRRANFFARAPGMGGFDAAKDTRLTEQWRPGDQSPSLIHQMDAKSLRDRCRDLALNNPTARSAIKGYVANVIENGITPDPVLPEGASKAVKTLWLDAWNRWAAEEADITGHEHLSELQATWLEEVLVAGGCLQNRVVLNRRESRGRRLPLSIELLPEERIADDRDFLNPTQSFKGNKIFRGVEVNKFGRAVAYWLRPTVPNELHVSFIEPTRRPAGPYSYGFIRDRVGQYRGWPVLAVSVALLWKLGYYTDNEMMASAIKSCFAVLITTESDANLPLDPNADTTNSDGNQLDNIRPGMVSHLEPGENVTGVAPNIPGGDSTPWLMMLQRTIGAGTELSYEELTRDYSQTTFSSNRASANADKRRFRMKQRFTINQFLAPIYPEFVMWAVQAGLEGFPTPFEFQSNRDEWIKTSWRTPGWPSVNPLDDAQANVLEIEHRLNSRANVLGDRGHSVEEIDSELEVEQESAEAHNLISTEQENAAQAASQPANPPQSAERG